MYFDNPRDNRSTSKKINNVSIGIDINLDFNQDINLHLELSYRDPRDLRL